MGADFGVHELRTRPPRAHPPIPGPLISPRDGFRWSPVSRGGCALPPKMAAHLFEEPL